MNLFPVHVFFCNCEGKVNNNQPFSDAFEAAFSLIIKVLRALSYVNN
nr:MAG TPA: hypothetical protein [Caudoviricetes sp.]